MIQRRCFLAIAALALILSTACSQKPDGSDFIGKWAPVNKGNRLGQIEFKKTGDTFFMTNALGKERVPAVYRKDGNTMQVDMVIMKVDFAYFKDRDTINALGHEWRRLK